MKVLIVDDSQTMRRVVAQAVAVAGMETLHAADAYEALRVLEHVEGDVDLILLDWNLPGMNGLELLKRIKSDARWSSKPVMMITTEGEKANIVKALQAGAANYLVKPFNAQDLAARIMQCLGKGA